MAKTRIDAVWPWEDDWIVSFEHTPWDFRTSPATHAIHVYQHIHFPWPERIWEMWFPSELMAKGFAECALANPHYFADVCFWCNYRYYFNAHVRWNIHRGQNRLWLPETTTLTFID